MRCQLHTHLNVPIGGAIYKLIPSPVSDVAREWGKAVTPHICRIFTEYDNVEKENILTIFIKKAPRRMTVLD